MRRTREAALRGWARVTPEAKAARMAKMNAARLARYAPEPTREELEKALWDKIEPEPNSGCWIFVGAIDGNGYGRLWSRRWPNRCRAAHRISYELARGPIPDGLEIDHLCRTRQCVNPAHMEPVTLIVNNHRGIGVAAINLKKTECERGHPLPPYMRGCTRVCLACRRLKHAENKEKHNAAHRAYYARNAERMRAYARRRNARVRHGEVLV